MAKEIQVNVEVKIGNRVIDLRVPNMVRIPHMKRVLVDALQMMRIPVPADFDLLLNDKPIEMFDTIVFDDYAFGDGDQLEIITKESKE